MSRQGVWVLAGVLLLLTGCGRWFADRTPRGTAPPELKRISLEIVARDNRCEPSVLAADREGRAILITFQVTSVGKQHVFQIPELEVRKTIPAGTQVSIPVIVDRSGVYDFGCTSFAWMTPLDSKGRLAIK